MDKEIQGVELTVIVDGRPFSGHYRRLSGNRLEVYTEADAWVAFIGPESLEEQAVDMLTRIARKQIKWG